MAAKQVRLAKYDEVVIKVVGTSGNFVKFGSDGQIADSGKSESDFVLASSVGANNGIAQLDGSGKVPPSQLPSYVDDVIEGYYDSTAGKFYEEAAKTTEIEALPGKIYIDITTGKDGNAYRYTGSQYFQISSQDVASRVGTLETNYTTLSGKVTTIEGHGYTLGNTDASDNVLSVWAILPDSARAQRAADTAPTV